MFFLFFTVFLHIDEIERKIFMKSLLTKYLIEKEKKTILIKKNEKTPSVDGVV
jgi:hypothetical protein